METVRDRIAWIIANRRTPETGEAWDAQNLSIAAGLAPAHIGMVLRKTIGEPRRPTLAKIAKATGVSLSWLMTGEGAPAPEGGPTLTAHDEHTQPAGPDEHVQAPAGGASIEWALGEVFDRTRYTLGDMVAVQKALGETFRFESGTDPLGAARTWLDAAARLRREGREVTTQSLLERVTRGSLARPVVEEPAEEDGDDGLTPLDAEGVEALKAAAIKGARSRKSEG